MTVALSPELGLSEKIHDTPVRRSVLAAFSAMLAAFCFLQAPGRIVADTKLDVAITPLTFLGHALNLWDPQQAFGGVPFQAYGYLIPMGPFFIVGHLLLLPTWVIQRLWVTTILAMAFWGVVRLAEALHIGSPTSRVIAALAFVLAPPVSLLGSTSGYILPYALLPWAILPLVRGAREGSPRIAASRSGVAVLFMGGINAAAVMAVLPLPFLWILTRSPGRRKKQLLSWWILAVVLACTWWAVSLFLEGRYGFNLVPFTETSSTTTATTSLFDILRGNSYWVSYNQIGSTAIQSGREALASPLMIIAGAILSGLGLFGLAHRGLKERTWLIGSFAVGIVLVGAGYPGVFGAQFSGFVQNLLSGPFSLFRNVWKFQPTVNLVLVLGLAHAVSTLAGPIRNGARTLRNATETARRSRLLILPLVVLALVGVSLPFLSGDFFPPGAFNQVPSYWQSTAMWLGRHSGTTTALVVPGSSFGVYTWGSPLDEPMQWLAESDWAVRGIIPDSSVGNIEMLDAVEQVLDGSVPSPGLAPFLGQAGVRYLVVRNDLATGDGAPPPLQVHQTLSASPGLAVVASFGPRRVDHFGRFKVALPAVEIYQVRQAVATVAVAPAANSVVVSGGSNALLNMDQEGFNPGNRAVFVAGDGNVPNRAQTLVVTDTNPREGVTFGAIRNNENYVLTPGATSPVTGKPPVGWTIVPGIAHQTVAGFSGARNVTSSSYGSYYLLQSPAEQPAAALDHDPSTSWVASATNNSLGQWIRVDFNNSIDVSHVTLRLDVSPNTPRVIRVMITTAKGSLQQRVKPSNAEQVLATPAGLTSWLKVTFTKVLPPRRPGLLLLGAGIRELSIPGVSIQKTLVVPNDELSRFSKSTSRTPIYVFTSPAPLTTYGYAYGGDDEEPRMARVFSTPRRATYGIHGSVSPRAGPNLAALLTLLGGRALVAEPFHLACGQGPTLTVDGTTLQTEVIGTFGGLTGFQQMRFSVCGEHEALTLPAGTHLLLGNAGGYLKIESVTISPYDTAPYASSSAPTRSVTVEHWDSQKRTVVVGAGDASYLTVKQNFNTGWTAVLRGEALKPFRINGWQQAWLLPKGAGGVVTIAFGPDSVYHLGLLIGALLVLLLVGLALWPSNRSEGAGALTSGPNLSMEVAVVLSSIVLVILGGVLALIFPILFAIMWLTRSRRWLPLLAALAYGVAGLVVAAHVGVSPESHLGAFGRPAQIGSIVAITAVFSSLVGDTTWWKRRTAFSPEADPSSAEGSDIRDGCESVP